MIRGLFGSGSASRIDERHWQGGLPDPTEWSLLRSKGFDALLLCAKELQGADTRDFPGVDVIFAPMDDAVLTPDEVVVATSAAKSAMRHLARGGRVLVTCAQGLNRSGLVSALVLVGRRKVSGEDAVRWVRSRRPGALTNQNFVDFLNRLW